MVAVEMVIKQRKEMNAMKLISFESVNESIGGKEVTQWHLNPAHIIGIQSNPNAFSKYCVYYVVINGGKLPVTAETAQRILNTLEGKVEE